MEGRCRWKKFIVVLLINVLIIGGNATFASGSNVPTPLAIPQKSCCVMGMSQWKERNVK